MDLVRLMVLGGALALDGTSVAQVMVSRPLVAGVLTGWAIGSPALGAAVGAVLELYLLVAFPTGGSRFPEGATATVVAVGSCAAVDGTGLIPLGVAMGLLWGHLGGLSITLLRRANGRLAPDPTVGSLSAGRLGAVQGAGLVMDFLRGALVSVSGVLMGRAVVDFLDGSWPLRETASMGLLLTGGAVSMGILMRDFGGVKRQGAWLALGAALGLAGARFL